MKRELEDLLAKIAWEGDYLYVIENNEDMVPDDEKLKAEMEKLHTAVKGFKSRLSELCIEHKVDPDDYEY